jgi:membrane-associated PAP2 superfamily phosphatase
MINSGALSDSKALVEVMRRLSVHDVDFEYARISPKRPAFVLLISEPPKALFGESIPTIDFNNGFYSAGFHGVRLIWKK